MALPIVTVVAATGAQGRGVVEALVPDKKYQIRALTSNASTTTAIQLKELPNVSVIEANLNSEDSLVSVFAGSVIVFANTIFNPSAFTPEAMKAAQALEEQHSLNIVRAASKTQSLRHLIWSTLPNSTKVTKGKYDIPHFMSKIKADDYVLSPESGLKDKTTFLRVGLYGSNLARPYYQPMSAKGTGKHVFVLPCSPSAVMPFVGDESINVGEFIKAIISQPEKTIGRYVLAGHELITCTDWVQALEKVLREQGRKEEVVFAECTLEAYESIWGAIGTEIGLMMRVFDEYALGGFDADVGPLPALTAKDLGIEDKLQSTEQRLKKINWQDFLY